MKLIDAFDKAFENSKLEAKNDSPTFLHFENFLDETFFHELEAGWTCQRQKWKASSLQANLDFSRIDIQRGDKQLSELCQGNGAWNEFVADSNSQELYSILFENQIEVFKQLGFVSKKNLEFDPKISDFARFSNTFKQRFFRKINKFVPIAASYQNIVDRFMQTQKVFSICNLAESSQGYKVPVHTDNSYKVIVGLLYFDNIEEGGELVLHGLKQSKHLSDCPRIPSENEVKELQRISPTRNSLVLFVNSNIAYHSVTPFQGELRRFVYVGFGLNNVKSAWKTNL
jgi:hypothetical protein